MAPYLSVLILADRLPRGNPTVGYYLQRDVLPLAGYLAAPATRIKAGPNRILSPHNILLIMKQRIPHPTNVLPFKLYIKQRRMDILFFNAFSFIF